MSTETGAPRSPGRTSPPQLRSITTKGWRRGSAPLLRKELGQWWGTRQWLVQAVTWVVLINGVVAMVMLTDPSEDPLTLFLLLGMLTTAIGVVVTTQGAVVGEKQRGTAAWLLSKPVSRSSFLLSKLGGFATGFWALAVALPGAVYVVESLVVSGSRPGVGPLSGALAFWALHVLVYLALVLALGTLFRSRGPVAAVGVGTILAGQFFGGMVPLPVVSVLPWILPDLANAVAHGDAVPVSIPLVVVANLTTVVVATGVGIWRLTRQEL
ncbi:MAG TPA: ABC transporter permease [Jiangellales bacterium]|nr:ABC transporter permease [Jiangellales bacterium]